MEISVPANYVSRARVTFRVDLRASARNYVKLHGAAGEEIVSLPRWTEKSSPVLRFDHLTTGATPIGLKLSWNIDNVDG